MDDATDAEARIGGRRPYHHGDLRAALLAAAETELEMAGIERFSLRAVAKRAGVSHAAPANHFDGADDLLTALAASGYVRLDAALRSEGDAAGRPADRIAHAAAAYVRFAMGRPALFRLMFSSARPDFAHPDLKAAADAAFMALVEDVRARTGADPFAVEDAMRELMIAWGLVHGLADLMNAGRLTPLLERPEAEREKIVRDLARRALGG